MNQQFSFSYEIIEDAAGLQPADAVLLEAARKATGNAYAPYSQFRVGAAARMENGEIISGSNQENASFPAGLCAERVLMATASSLFPRMPIVSLAVSYNNGNGPSDHPIAPCGVCRQSFQEFEQKTGKSIRLILGGMEGKVWIIPEAGSLLPLAFTLEELG